MQVLVLVGRQCLSVASGSVNFGSCSVATLARTFPPAKQVAPQHSSLDRCKGVSMP